MTIRLVYPAKDGYVGITHVFGPAIGPATARLMDWVHEAGFCTAEQRDKDWVGYLELIESGAEPIEAWEAVKAAVEAFCLSRTKAELLEGALARRLLVAPIADTADVVDSAQFNARGYFDQVHSEAAGRDVAAPGPFAKASGTPLRRLGPAPRIGQHTAEVIAERRSAAPAGPERTRELPLTGIKVLDFTWSIAGPLRCAPWPTSAPPWSRSSRSTSPTAPAATGPSGTTRPGSSSPLCTTHERRQAEPGARPVPPRGPRRYPRPGPLGRRGDRVVLAPGDARWGFDYDNLRQLNPGLIMLSTCLCGQDGPLRDFAGYGNLGASFAGFYGLAGWPDRPPAGPFGAYTDYTSTHVILATLLAAIDHRRRTGEGQHLDISQAEAAMHFLSPALLDRSVNGRIMERAGNTDPHLAPHGVYPATGEDRWVAVACQGDQVWPALCGVLGRPDLAEDRDLQTGAGRLARQVELDAAVAAWTATKDPEDAACQLQAAGVAAYQVQNSAECLADPQLAHRSHFVTLDHPRGQALVENTRFKLAATPVGPQGPPPTLGEHTWDVLAGILGYDEEKIASLAAQELLE